MNLAPPLILASTENHCWSYAYWAPASNPASVSFPLTLILNKLYTFTNSPVFVLYKYPFIAPAPVAPCSCLILDTMWNGLMPSVWAASIIASM